MQMREGWLLENTSAFLSQSDAVRIVYRSSISQGFIPASMAQSVQRPQQEFRAISHVPIFINKSKADIWRWCIRIHELKISDDLITIFADNFERFKCIPTPLRAKAHKSRKVFGNNLVAVFGQRLIQQLHNIR